MKPMFPSSAGSFFTTEPAGRPPWQLSQAALEKNGGLVFMEDLLGARPRVRHFADVIPLLHMRSLDSEG